jgi:hypothetical protein
VRNGVAMHLRSSWISLEYEAHRDLYYLQLIFKKERPSILVIISISDIGPCQRKSFSRKKEEEIWVIKGKKIKARGTTKKGPA